MPKSVKLAIYGMWPNVFQVNVNWFEIRRNKTNQQCYAPFDKYFLTTCHVPDSTQGSGSTAVNQTQSQPPSHLLSSRKDKPAKGVFSVLCDLCSENTSNR